MNRINQEKLNAEQAAELLGLSERHVQRLLSRYRADGASALAHGNRGRPSTHWIEEGQRKRIVSQPKSEYAGVNQLHFTELLAEREQLPVSRSTVRRVLAEAGIGRLSGRSTIYSVKEPGSCGELENFRQKTRVPPRAAVSTAPCHLLDSASKHKKS